MKVSCLILFLGISRCYGRLVGQPIKTSSGPVSGHAATVNSDVSVYLGIPYALPPVGNLRFMPPKKYHGDKPINGSSIVCFSLSPDKSESMFSCQP
jgi:carboxylesterase type B